jgi:molecular chaperone DnaK
MGCQYDDPEIAQDRRLLPYKIVRASNGDAWVEIQGRQYSPSKISAMILQKLRADAEVYLNERITQAVIAVPASFNERQRQATRDAGKIAGLDVVRIINEPIAASLAYGWRRKNDTRILVYNWGGGSFDVSILECGAGAFEVKSSCGDIHLGGDDFDQRIMSWLSDEFCREHGIDLRQDRMALPRLKEAAEKAKCELSSSISAEINLPFITTDSSGPKHLNLILTRAKLEQLVDDLIERSRRSVMKALAEARVMYKGTQRNGLHCIRQTSTR